MVIIAFRALFTTHSAIIGFADALRRVPIAFVVHSAFGVAAARRATCREKLIKNGIAIFETCSDVCIACSALVAQPAGKALLAWALAFRSVWLKMLYFFTNFVFIFA